MQKSAWYFLILKSFICLLYRSDNVKHIFKTLVGRGDDNSSDFTLVAKKLNDNPESLINLVPIALIDDQELDVAGALNQLAPDEVVLESEEPKRLFWDSSPVNKMSLLSNLQEDLLFQSFTGMV